MRRKMFSAILLGTMVMGAIATNAATVESTSIQKHEQLSENQSMIMGKITEINGNEITFVVCEKPELTEEALAERVARGEKGNTGEGSELTEEQLAERTARAQKGKAGEQSELTEEQLAEKVARGQKGNVGERPELTEEQLAERAARGQKGNSGECPELTEEALAEGQEARHHGQFENWSTETQTITVSATTVIEGTETDLAVGDVIRLVTETDGKVVSIQVMKGKMSTEKPAEMPEVKVVQ